MEAPHHPEFTLPALDLRWAARRAALPLGLAVAVLAVAVLAGGPLQALADAWERVMAADGRWMALAAGAELLSFGGYIVLLWLVGHRASPRLGFRASAEISLGGAAATRLLPTAGAGGVAVTLWAIARSGLGTRGGGRVLLTFLVLLYGVFLAGIALSGAAIAAGLGGSTGHAVLAGGAAVLASLGIAAGLVLGRERGDGRPPVAVPGRLRRGATLLGEAVRDARTVLRGADARLLGAPAWWLFDLAVLWAAFEALGEPPALPIIAFAYFAGQVGNTIPVPGAVSGGLVGMLLLLGVEADYAISAVFTYRTLAIWVPAPFGLAALGALRARIGRWQREDGGAAAPEAVAAPERVVAPEPAAPVLPRVPRRLPAAVPAATARPCAGCA